VSSTPHSRAKEAFFAALELEGAARAEFLDVLAARDTELAAQVRSLLAAHQGESAARLERAPAALGVALKALRSPGQRIGDYELLEEVGAGAFGSVWRARQVSLDRIVALKLLKSGRLADERDHARLRAEAEAVARLDHPHIVPIYEVGEVDGLSFFSMKWIEGGPLAERLAAPWSARRAALLMADVARAVHHAHQRGLLHRDLKPSNVLLDELGAPHVADFGIAKRLDGESSATTTTMLAGTPAYMAPEQADGGELTVATDVWALGCVLYELLSAQRAFGGDSITETLRKVRQDEPTPLRKLRADTPRDLETIVLVCLRKDAARRYASANKLADDLERWLEHEPISARRTGALERLQLFSQRSPLAATLIGVVSALVLLLAFVATWASFELGARLRDSYLGEARATRLSSVPGARAKALELLGRAAAIRGGDDLRNETIASLALSDVVLERTVPRDIGVDARGWIDPKLERIVVLDGRDARVVDASTAVLVAELPLPREVTYARWSGDGKWMLFKLGPLDAAPSSASIWSMESYAEQLAIEEPIALRAADFARNGSELAYVTEHGELVFVDLLARAERARFELGASADALTFSPRGDEFALLYGGVENLIQFRSPSDGALLRQLTCVARPFQIAWLPDGGGFALACGDAKIRVYDEVSSNPHLVLAGHSAEVVDLIASPTSPLLMSYAWDETTRLWDALTGRELRSLSARALGFDESGERLAVLDARAWSLWRIQHGELLRAARAHTSKSPVALTFAGDGATIASAGPDGLWIWNFTSSARPQLVFERELRSVAFVEDANVLVASGPEGLWRIDLRSSEEPRIVFDAPLWDLALAGGAPILAAQERDAVHLLDTSNWTSLQRLSGAPQLEYLSLSRDGARVASGSWRGFGVHVWDVDGPPVARQHFAAVPNISAVLSPDGTLLATTTGERFELVRADSGESLLTLERQRSFGVTPGPVAFRPDGGLVAFGLASSSVRLVELPSLRVWSDLTLPTPDAIADLAFSPDGSRLAAGCSTNTIQVWDLERLAREVGR
jgi:WD40 repeat protein